MKSRVFKYIILLTVVSFSMSSLYLAHNKNLGRKLLHSNQSNYFNGDLFDMSHVLNFKDKLTVIEEKEETHTINEANIITMGDSFFNVNYNSDKLPDLLEKTTNSKVFKVERTTFGNYGDNPLKYLKETGYVKGPKKYLVLETVERYSIERSLSYMNKLDNEDKTSPTPQSNTYTPWYNYIQNRIPFGDLNYFFYNNIIISPLMDLGKTIKFNTIRDIDPRTPAYSSNPSNLFYYEDVTFARRQKSDTDIKKISSGIEYLANELRDKYNLELIYILIPNKFTIYGSTSNIHIPYDDYIPRVVKELHKTNIKAPEMYTIFKSTAATSPEPLYYKADTHYSPIAKNLTLDEIIKLINN